MMMVDRGRDFKLREAERRWYSELGPQAWAAYLKEARRAGQPIFDAGFIADAIQGQVVGFQYTEDGFVAEVEDAFHPQIEQEFRIGPEDSEYFPLWDLWSGIIRVVWDTYLEPACPTLSLTVGSYANEHFLHTPHLLTHFVGEDFVFEGDCVASREQFIEAMQQTTLWTT